MSGIPLDPKLGVNAKLTFCRRCGGEARELMLIGSNKGIYKCAAGHTMFGRPTPNTSSGDCPSCGRLTSWTKTGEIGEYDKLPSSEPCDSCKEELAEHEKLVDQGGVYVKCVDCGVQGVAKPGTNYAKFIREMHQKQESEKRHTGIVDGWYTTPMHNKKNEMVYLPVGGEINKKIGCERCLQLEEKKGANDDGGPSG